MTAIEQPVLDLELRSRIDQFLSREARLLDELRYEEWEALWDDDAIYWIPANADDSDPTRTMSIVFDNRSRIRTRVRQLLTGKRHAQAPPSRLCRLVSNIELFDRGDIGDAPDDVIGVGANVLVVESRSSGTRLWAGRSTYQLRDHGDRFALVRKDVRLVDNDRAIPTLAFLL
jgi:3-phenylpropionate/cinnamic acid dioxygenase small subunit